MIKPTLLITLAALSAGAFALPTLEFTGVGKGLNSKWTMDGGSSYKTTFAGELGVRLTTVSGASDFFGFCTSPTVTMQGSGSWAVTIGDTTLLTPNGDRIANLVNTFAPGIRASGSNAEAAAMQLSIWELLTETSGTYDLTTGNFKATKDDGTAFDAPTINIANTYLNLGGSSTAPYYKSGSGANGQFSQDIVTPVPEPATIAAFGLGAVALLRRRAKKA